MYNLMNRCMRCITLSILLVFEKCWFIGRHWLCWRLSRLRYNLYPSNSQIFYQILPPDINKLFPLFLTILGSTTSIYLEIPSYNLIAYARRSGHTRASKWIRREAKVPPPCGVRYLYMLAAQVTHHKYYLD